MDRILDSIDFHVATYNLWGKDMTVVISPETFSDLIAETSWMDPLSNQFAYQSITGMRNQIAGVDVHLVHGIPRGEWVIACRPTLVASFDYTLTVT